MNVGPVEFWVVMAAVILLFGTKKLPELGSGLGGLITNFKKSYKEGQTIDVTPDKATEEKGSTSEVKQEEVK